MLARPDQVHSFGLQTGSNSSRQETISHKTENRAAPADNFEEERLKDAVNFKNLMQTVQQSRGFNTI